MTAVTHDRILDGALRVLTQHGLAKLTLDDVAREADLSRQTVYRYFGSKDGLIRAVLRREEERFLATILGAVGDGGELRPALERAITLVLRQARQHPLLDRLLETEPEALLPLLLTGEGPVLPVIQPVLEQVLGARLPHLSDLELRRAADASGRLLVSYAINPPDDPIDDVAASLAEFILYGVKPS